MFLDPVQLVLVAPARTLAPQAPALGVQRHLEAVVLLRRVSQNAAATPATPPPSITTRCGLDPPPDGGVTGLGFSHLYKLHRIWVSMLLRSGWSDEGCQAPGIPGDGQPRCGGGGGWRGPGHKSGVHHKVATGKRLEVAFQPGAGAHRQRRGIRIRRAPEQVGNDPVAFTGGDFHGISPGQQATAGKPRQRDR